MMSHTGGMVEWVSGGFEDIISSFVPPKPSSWGQEASFRDNLGTSIVYICHIIIVIYLAMLLH